MKRLFFLLLILIPVVLWAQEIPDVPADVGEVLTDPLRFFGQLTGLCGLTIFVVQALKLWLKWEQKWPKIVLSIIVGTFWAAVSNLLNFGLFAQSEWLDTVVWGAVAIGPVAGVVYDIPTARTLVNLIFAIIQFKKPTE